MKVRNSILRSIASFVLLVLLIFTYSCGSNSTGSYSSGSGNGGGNSQPAFESGQIGSGETYSHTFDNEGTFEYYCENHSPDMQGTITVQSGAEISEQDTVEMKNTEYNPSSVTVAPGTEITWINRDNYAHTVTEGNPSTSGGDGGGSGGY